MPTPLAVHDLRVSIFYGMFGLRDQWCDAGDGGESLAASRETVAGASTYQLTVQAKSHVAGVRIRLWGEEPEPDGGLWGGCHQVALHCPTGQLVVEQVTAGTAAEIALPAGSGVYEIRICWKGREAAQDAIMATYDRFRGAPFEELSAALGRLDGMERFLVDIWWREPLPPDEDDDDFYGGEWS